MTHILLATCKDVQRHWDAVIRGVPCLGHHQHFKGYWAWFKIHVTSVCSPIKLLHLFIHYRGITVSYVWMLT